MQLESKLGCPRDVSSWEMVAKELILVRFLCCLGSGHKKGTQTNFISTDLPPKARLEPFCGRDLISAATALEETGTRGTHPIFTLTLICLLVCLVCLYSVNCVRERLPSSGPSRALSSMYNLKLHHKPSLVPRPSTT